jgi:type III pantothenate kinase
MVRFSRRFTVRSPDVVILADVGNTRIKWAVAAGEDGVSHACTTRTRLHKSALCRSLERLAKTGKPRGVAIAGVVPEVCALLAECAVQVAPAEGVQILDYDAFRSVMPIDVGPVISPGADRLANAYALRSHYELPACAVDVGSALTVDVVDVDGRFVGGAIAPGIRMQFDALRQNTALLGQVISMPRTNAGIGTDTAAAMAVGIRRGMPWAVVGIVRGIAAELGCALKSVVVTGGDARPVYRVLRSEVEAVHFDKELTLKGLASAYRTLSAAQ